MSTNNPNQGLLNSLENKGTHDVELGSREPVLELRQW